MKVDCSSIIGFCSGVERVLELAKRLLEGNEKVYCIGELAHNKHVMEAFKAKGLVCIENASGQEPGVAIIGAHGIADSKRSEFERSGYTLVDGTCPLIHVSRSLIIKNAKHAKACLIAGQKGHAEVEGLMDTWVFEGVKAPAFVVESPEDVESLPDGLSYFLLCQTTFQTDAYEQIKQAVLDRFPQAKCKCTICNSSLKRRSEASRLAHDNDVVVVVGSERSANSKALASLVEKEGAAAVLVDSLEMLPSLKSAGRIGLCSGSSAPREDVMAIKEALENA